MKLIQHQSDVKEGDIIIYYCSMKLKDVTAEVIGTLDEVGNIILCRQLTDLYTDLVDFTHVSVYIQSKDTCSCGASHTSNKLYHLSYCDLA